MNIVMITASLPPLPAGGAELQAMELAVELRKKNIGIRFLTPGKKDLKGMVNWNDIEVYHLFSLPSRLFDFFSGIKKRYKEPESRIEFNDQKELTDEITRKVRWPTLVYYHIFFMNCLLFLWPRRRSFDIIHAHTMEWSAIVAARLGRVLGKPVIVKDSTMNGFKSLRRFPNGRNLQKMIIRGCTFIAMTQVIEENLRRAGIPVGKIVRIPNGINLSNNPARVIRSAHLPVVLFVGNLYQQPAKGIDILLKAWCLVNKEHPKARLEIIGDGKVPPYIQFAEKLGIASSVQFLGKQSNLSLFYEKAALFVLPSRREGMSSALMEAMLYGLPCVATNISGSQDLIKNGVNGILVAPKDEKGLAAAISFLISHPETAGRMGEEAREKITGEFGMSLIANRYISLYESLLDSKTE